MSRRVGERILIGDDIAITVVRIGPGSIRIGIDAPKDMNIVRQELCKALSDATGLSIELASDGEVAKAIAETSSASEAHGARGQDRTV